MRDLEPPFELHFNEELLRIAEHEIKGKRVFYVNFSSGLKPLVIGVGLNLRDQKFWTSIPEGRQKEAAAIGKLIAVYIRNKRK